MDAKYFEGRLLALECNHTQIKSQLESTERKIAELKTELQHLNFEKSGEQDEAIFQNQNSGIKSSIIPEVQTPKETPPALPVENKVKDHRKRFTKSVSETKEKVLKVHQENKFDFSKLELNFGRIWLVRLGIVSLLTGLIFLSNYAYKNFIMEWGAMPRVIGLYLLSLVLLFLGSYFEKKKENLKNYGRVLAAGGLAVFYYTSYAAHHMERLQVIDSPLLGGIVLAGSALACLGYALYKKSDITAILSIILAFYATSINPIGSFTLISSTFLTAVGVILLLKLKNTTIGFTTLICSYASYTYWQLAVNQTESPHAHYFLIGYWVLSAIAYFAARDTIKKELQVLYASVNHSAFFLLFSISSPPFGVLNPSWQFSAIFGSLLIALSFVIRYFQTHDHNNVQTHLGKGIGLITLALCIGLEGTSLAISLAIQAGVLLILSYVRKNTLLEVAGTLTLASSFFVYFAYFATCSPIQHAILATLFILISIGSGITLTRNEDTDRISRGLPLLFGLVALTAFTCSLSLSSIHTVLILLTLALLGQSSVFLKQKWNKLPELPILSHLFTLVSFVKVFEFEEIYAIDFGIISLILVAITTIHCSLRLKNKEHVFHAVYLALFNVSFFITLLATENANLVLCILAAVGLAYHYLFTKCKIKSFQVLGLFHYLLNGFVMLLALAVSRDVSPLSYGLVALSPFIHYLAVRGNYLPLTPFIKPYLTTVFAASTYAWLSIQYTDTQLIITILALTLFYIEERKQLTSLSVIGFTYLVLAVINMQELPQFSQYLIAGSPVAAYFIVQVQKNRKLQPAILITLAVFGSILLWITASQHVLTIYGSSGLSITWAILGFLILSLGLVTKTATFRTIGFIVLGCCILHVYGVDVWRLTALVRILSFIVLGLVLLLAGYFYCRKTDTNESSS